MPHDKKVLTELKTESLHCPVHGTSLSRVLNSEDVDVTGYGRAIQFTCRESGCVARAFVLIPTCSSCGAGMRFQEVLEDTKCRWLCQNDRTEIVTSPCACGGMGWIASCGLVSKCGGCGLLSSHEQADRLYRRVVSG